MAGRDRWFFKCSACKKPFAVETPHDQGESAESLAKTMVCPKCGYRPERGATVEVYVWDGAEAPQRTWKFKNQAEADTFAVQLRSQIHDKGWPHSVRVRSDVGKIHRLMGRVKEHVPNQNIPCNAACFYAPGPNCECSCGGANHGRGHVVSVEGMPVLKAEDPEQPGIRGGRYYRTDTGRIRYGVRHEPIDVHDLLAHAQQTKRKLWQVGTCRQCGMAVMMHWSPAAERVCPGCHGVVEAQAGRVGMSEAEAEQRVGTYGVLRTTQEESLTKAEQLGLGFVQRKDPEQPGVRGGKYYRTETGHVRYGEREARRQGLKEGETGGIKSPVTPDNDKWTRERPTDQVRVGGLGILGSMPSRASKRGRWLVYIYDESVGDRAKQEYSRGWIKDNGKALIASLMANEHPGKILDDKGNVVAQNEAWSMRHAGKVTSIPTEKGWVAHYTDRSGRPWYSRERFARPNDSAAAANALALELDGPPPESDFERQQRETREAIEASKAGGAQHLDQVEPVVGMRVKDFTTGDLGTIAEVGHGNPKLYGPGKRIHAYVRWDTEPEGSAPRGIELSHTIVMPIEEPIVLSPRQFPVFEGEELSWNLALYHTRVEQKAGLPRMRTVIRAMRQYRPEQLEREKMELRRATVDRVFGHSAQAALDVIESEDRGVQKAKPTAGRSTRGETADKVKQPSEHFATVHGPDQKGNPAGHHFRVVRGDKPGTLRVAPEHRGRVKGALTGQVEAVSIEELCTKFECVPSPELGMPVPSDPEAVHEAILEIGEKITKDLKLPAGGERDNNETNETLPEEVAEDQHALSPLVNRLLKTVASEAGGEVQGNVVMVDRPDQLQPVVDAIMREVEAAGGTVAIDNGFEEPDEFGWCALQCRVNLVSGSERNTEILVAITLRSMASVKERLKELRKKMEDGVANPEQATAAGMLLSLSALQPFA